MDAFSPSANEGGNSSDSSGAGGSGGSGALRDVCWILSVSTINPGFDKRTCSRSLGKARCSRVRLLRGGGGGWVGVACQGVAEPAEAPAVRGSRTPKGRECVLGAGRQAGGWGVREGQGVNHEGFHGQKQGRARTRLTASPMDWCMTSAGLLPHHCLPAAQQHPFWPLSPPVLRAVGAPARSVAASTLA